jgi:hypothetical protein
MIRSHNFLFLTIIISTIILATNSTVFAHCDGLDGPVVKAAKKSLETGDVNHALIWIQKKDEAEIIKAFNRTLALRKLNAETKEMADMYFFETLVRIHRAGEGEPYTGLKPAGRDLGHIIPASDEAIHNENVDKIKHHLTTMMIKNIQDRFNKVIMNKSFTSDKVDTGRKYVEAYVEFLHYAEKLYAYLEGEDALHKH